MIGHRPRISYPLILLTSYYFHCTQTDRRVTADRLLRNAGLKSTTDRYVQHYSSQRSPLTDWRAELAVLGLLDDSLL